MFGTRLPSVTLRTAASRAGIVVTLVAASALLVACGGGSKEKKATQVAAKVNKEEITVHQINFLLQRQAGIKPEQKGEASRMLLESLINNELAYQKAVDQKIDRDPNVLEMIEMTKRELVVQNYFQRVAAGAKPPTEAEVKDYYDKHPALFSARRIYSFQEITIEAKPEQVEGLRAKVAASKTMQELDAMLQAEGVRVSKTQVVRPAEQLPLAQLDAIAQMKDGQVTMQVSPPGLHVLILAGSEEKPVALDKAKPVIEMYLTNERKRQLIEAEGKNLRATAKIEYVGEFAASAPKPGGTAATPGAAEAASEPVAPMVTGEPASAAASGAQ